MTNMVFAHPATFRIIQLYSTVGGAYHAVDPVSGDRVLCGDHADAVVGGMLVSVR